MFGIDDAIIGGGIGAVGNVLGGLLGGSQHDSAGDQLRSTVNAARQMGISPLAALGGSTSWGPVNPMGDAVANAGASIGRAIANRDPNADLQSQLLKAQIAATNAQAADSLSSARSRTLLANARRAATGGPVTVAPPSEISLGDYGKFKLNKWDPAQKIENELGDPFEGAYGIARAVDSLVRDNLWPWLQAHGVQWYDPSWGGLVGSEPAPHGVSARGPF